MSLRVTELSLSSHLSFMGLMRSDFVVRLDRRHLELLLLLTALFVLLHGSLAAPSCAADAAHDAGDDSDDDENRDDDEGDDPSLDSIVSVVNGSLISSTCTVSVVGRAIGVC